MKYLTEAEIGTIDYAKTSIRERARLPATDVETLLSIIHRQNSALEKAIEGMEAMVSNDMRTWSIQQERIGNMAVVDITRAEITAIMNGEVKNG